MSIRLTEQAGETTLVATGQQLTPTSGAGSVIQFLYVGSDKILVSE